VFNPCFMITKSFLSSGNGLTIRQSQRALRVAHLKR
jgi:hypothetical protein